MRRLAALLLLLVATACSSATQSSDRALRFDLAADPSTLNPLFIHQDAAAVEQQLARLLFEPFVDLDARGRAIPELLAAIPTAANGGVSADGRTITYHLRRNVRWSDGVPVTSEDVLYTLHAILDPRNPVRSHEGYDLIDRAYARDRYTVVLHLKHAWAPAVLTYFSYGYAPQFVLPAHALRAQEPLARAPFNGAPTVGDGPYTFVRWVRGESIRYVANPRYWRGVPKIAALDVRVVPAPSTNLVMLRSGQLDWNLIAPSQQQSLLGDDDIAYRYVPTATVAGIAINTAHVPLDDARVRRAIAMSIDRASISTKITLGRYPVTDMLQPQFSWAYDPAVKMPAYDPRAADALFERAGWLRGPGGVRTKNGKRLALVYVQFPESFTGVRVAEVVQSELRARGLDVTIKSISNAQLFLPLARGGTLASGDFDLAYVPWTMGADPDDSAIVTCTGTTNYMRFCDPRVDMLETRALRSTSQSERKQLYTSVARIIAQQVPIVYLFDANYVYAYRRDVRGFAPNAFVPTWNAGAWSLR